MPDVVLRADKLAKTFRLGFLRKRIQAVREVVVRGEPGRGVRVPGAQRRGQDHHPEDADGAHLPQRRARRGAGPAGAHAGRQAAAGLPARDALLLRLPDARGVPGPGGGAVGCAPGRAAAAGRQADRPGGAGPRPRAAAAQVQQGDAAAGGHRPGADGRSRAGGAGRADDRPGPAGAQGDPRPDPGAEAGGADGVLFHPHPARRGDDLRPGGDGVRRADQQRGAAGRSCCRRGCCRPRWCCSRGRADRRRCPRGRPRGRRPRARTPSSCARGRTWMPS